ncbi:MAG: hypothetical protein ACYSWP_20970 [Planctomycetota bacterium]
MRQRNIWALANFMILPFCYNAYTNGFWKKTALILSIVIITHLVLLNSRSVFVALLVSSLLLKKVRWLAIAGVVLLVLFRPHVLDSLSLHYRIEQWIPTLKMICQNPMGVGVGNWWIEFPWYAQNIDYPDVFIVETFRFPHNDFLWAWSEVGIGIVFYLGIFVYSLWTARKQKWALMFILGYMASAFFMAPRERPFPTLMLFTVVALISERKPIPQPRLCLAVLLFALVVFGFRVNSSCENRKLRGGIPTNGYSCFSTLTYTGIPWDWWNGIKAYQNDRGLACHYFDRSYKYNPNSLNALNGKGIACAHKGDYKGAEMYFERSLKINKDFEDGQNNLAKVRKRLAVERDKGLKRDNRWNGNYPFFK